MCDVMLSSEPSATNVSPSDFLHRIFFSSPLGCREGAAAAAAAARTTKRSGLREDRRQRMPNFGGSGESLVSRASSANDRFRTCAARRKLGEQTASREQQQQQQQQQQYSDLAKYYCTTTTTVNGFTCWYSCTTEVLYGCTSRGRRSSGFEDALASRGMGLSAKILES